MVERGSDNPLSNGLGNQGAGLGQRRELLRHPFADPRKHRGPTGQDHVRVEVLTDVHVALHDGLEGGVVDPVRLLPDEARLEQDLRATEPLVPDGDDIPCVMHHSLLKLAAAEGRQLSAAGLRWLSTTFRHAAS